MNKYQIISAVEKALMGIERYLEIMRLFPCVDVSVDTDFQRKYNGFYKVRQRSAEWYQEYFSYMEKHKGDPVGFEAVLDHLKQSLGRYEPSFSSKLAATLDPNQPVWDKYVLENTGHKAPAYSDPKRFEQAKCVFSFVREWYSQVLNSPEGLQMITIFDDIVDEHHRITNLKKIDFILWQTRN